MQAAQEVGKELHLPPNWLNEQATIYLSSHKDFSLFKMYPSEGCSGSAGNGESVPQLR